MKDNGVENDNVEASAVMISVVETERRLDGVTTLLLVEVSISRVELIDCDKILVKIEPAAEETKLASITVELPRLWVDTARD
jgi:hypothetical protein